MGVMDEFLSWYSKLEMAVTEALHGPLKDGLEQEIREQAANRVYNAYGGGFRRGKIGAAENLSAKVNGFELHIRNVTPPQGGRAYQTETGFVEEGAPEFRQPFPRPFMEEALVQYTYGKAPDDLADFLRSMGFTVT